jgi:hypothetical protein
MVSEPSGGFGDAAPRGVRFLNRHLIPHQMRFRTSRNSILDLLVRDRTRAGKAVHWQISVSLGEAFALYRRSYWRWDRAWSTSHVVSFPGLWHHGDFAEWTEHGDMIIHGRSDATLNPQGVRIGTAEIYRDHRRGRHPAHQIRQDH